MNSTEIGQSIRPSMAVVGGGTMGVGIAYVYAAAGWITWVAEPDDGRASTMMATLTETAQAGLQRGKLTNTQKQDLLARIQRVSSVPQLPLGLDLVVESVPERLPLKQLVLREIDARSAKLIASNTSSMSIDLLAQSVSDPLRFIGMHYFNPVWSLQLVELIRGECTSESTVALARRRSPR